ncbi:sulfotransferase [Ekhidna sp.]|jgi:hypothetical protein|uniref:sulfotransferase n=1 Tax=Ekhidna sp. TaxID=2608089 RepID=UPI0032EBE050
MSQVFTVAGMHRSGTSLVANWFYDSQFFIGFDLLEAASSNKKGHFEDLDFLELHQKDLREKGYHQSGLIIKEDQEWRFNAENFVEASSLINKRSSFNLWGWKEPRSTLYLKQWKQLIPNLKVIGIYRHPELVVKSLYKRLKRNKWYYTRNPMTRLKWFIDIDNNPKKWHKIFSNTYTIYNNKMISFHKEYPNDSILINVNDLLNDESRIVSQIEMLLGEKLNFVPFSTVYKKELMKAISDNLNLSGIESSLNAYRLMEDLKG